MIAILEPPGIIISSGDLEPGKVTDITVTPALYKVQQITDLTITFTVEHTHYVGSDITFEFPYSIILPITGTPITITPDEATAAFWVATQGIVVTGNTIKVAGVFGTTDPPTGSLTMTVVFKNIRNPDSS